MTLLAPKVSEVYALGTIIEANAPPSGKWLPCQGQILSQADYPALYAMMDNPHPMLYSDLQFCDDYDTGGDYPYSEKVTWNGSAVWVSTGWDGFYSRSTDGITWTLGSLPVSGDYVCAWNGTVFCAIKYGATQVYTSTDGSSWTSRTASYAYNWSDIVWDGTNFIAIAANNTQTIKSTDGITWSNGGVLPETPFYYATSDGAGTIVAIDSGADMAISVNGGTNWTKVEGPQGPWLSVEYCNGYFLIATSRSYVGISSDGLDWEWVSYASDIIEPFDNISSNAASIWRWKYHDSIYFGVPNQHPVGLYSFDLRTFHPWFCNPYSGELHDVVYNSSSGNLTCFGGYGYSMPYSQKVDRYNDSTHFKLPNYFTHRFFEYGKHHYIKVL